MALTDRALAEQLVREAGSLAAQMLVQGLEVKRKTSISDVVSAADHAAEALVVQRLLDERPEDGLVGEEGARRPGERTWYIDPVDGTYNFVQGLPIWCSAVALVDDSGPIVGAVYHPFTGELWLGGPDYPTTCNGVPVGPLVDHGLDEVAIASYLHPNKMNDLQLREPIIAALSQAATIRMLGSGSIELSYVAGGRLGGWLQPNTLPWDWLPGVALVRGAGGATDVIEVGEDRLHLAGSPQVVRELRELVLS